MSKSTLAELEGIPYGAVGVEGPLALQSALNKVRKTTSYSTVNAATADLSPREVAVVEVGGTPTWVAKNAAGTAYSMKIAPGGGDGLNSFLNFGADNTGGTSVNNAAILTAALALTSVYVPEGTYLFTSYITIPSNRSLICHPNAVMKLANGALMAGKPCLIANAHPDTGDENIIIEGGIWDFNSANNPRTDTAYQPQSGFRLKRVENHTIRNLTVKNPVRFSILLTLCTNGNVFNVHAVNDYTVLNDDLVHCSGCKGMTLDGLSAVRAYDDLVCFQTGDSQFWQHGSDGHGPSLNNTARNIHVTLGVSGCRNMSINGELSDGILFENITGSFEGAVVFMADAVSLPGPNYGSLTVRNIRAGRVDSAQHLLFPILKSTAAIRDLTIDGIQRPEGDTLIVPIISLEDGYGGTFGRVLISNIQETASVRRTLISVLNNISMLCIDGATIKAPYSGSQCSLVYLYPNVAVNRLRLTNCHSDGLDGLVEGSNNNTVDAVFENCSVDNCQMMCGLYTSSTVNLTVIGCTCGPSIVRALVHIASSRLVLGAFSGNRITPGGALIKVDGNGTGAHRIIGAGNSGSLAWVPATNTLSVDCGDFSVDETLLTPISGDRIRALNGQVKNFYGATWH